MATPKQDDLFAAPTPEELSDEELFAPPMAEDQADDALFAAPTQVEPPVAEAPAYEPMGKLQAAAISADPLFISPQVGGLAAVAGSMAGRPAGFDESIDKAMAKTEKVIAKLSKKDLTKKKNLDRLNDMMANLEDQKKLKDPSYKKIYYEGVESAKELEAKAFEDQPGAAVAGMIGGGFMSPIPGSMIGRAGKIGQAVSKVLPSTKGLKRIGEAKKYAKSAEKLGLKAAKERFGALATKEGFKIAAREGAKAGVLAGMSRGDAKLLEGDVEGFVKDAMVGGAIGTAFGAGMQGTLNVGGKLLMNSGVANHLKRIFQEGVEGKGVHPALIAQELGDTADKYVKDFTGRIQKTGADIGKLYKEVSEPGEKIGIEEFTSRLRGLSEYASEGDKATMRKLAGVMDDYSLGGKHDTKMVETLQKKVLDKQLGSVGSVERAKIKQADKQLKEAIESQKAPISRDDLGEISSKDILPGEGPEVKAQVGHQIFEDVTPEGITQRHKVSAEKLKEFKPSKIQQGVDPESGREFAIAVDKAGGAPLRVLGEIQKDTVKDLSPEDLHKLVRKLESIKTGALDPNTKQEFRDVTRDIRKKLTESIKDPDKKEELLKLNKTYHNLKNIEGRIGLDVTDPVQIGRNVEKMILGAGDKGDTRGYSDFLKNLRKVDRNLATEIQKEVESLRFRFDVAQIKESYTRDISSIATSPVGIARKAWDLSVGNLISLITKGTNAVGRATGTTKDAIKTGIGKVSDTAVSLANRTLNISQASPDEIQSLINKLTQSGSPTDKHFLRPLKQAWESKNHRSRQALMYGLSQQQAFIEAVDRIGDVGKPEEK